MKSAPSPNAPPLFAVPGDEDTRLAALACYDLDGSAIEPLFDQLAEMAATLFDVPVCLISIIGRDDQWFIGRFGVQTIGLPRTLSLCNETLLEPGIRFIPDLPQDARFAHHPIRRTMPDLRFYAGTPLVTADGHRIGTFCVIDGTARHDFPERDRALLVRLAIIAARALDDRRATLTGVAARRFVETTALAIVTADRDGRISFWNDAAEAIFGWSATQAIGQDLTLIVPDRFREAHRAGVARLLADGVPTLAGKTVEVQAIGRNGVEFPIELTLNCWQDDGGYGFGAHIQDISARRKREACLQHLAHHDELTGLLNRRGFMGRVEGQIRDHGAATVLALDLDSFKSVNDAFGHAVGDAFLQALSLRLIAAATDGTAVGRIGGDEFALLLGPGTVQMDAVDTAHNLLAAFVDPISIAQHDLQVGVSIGIAMAPIHGTDVEELMLRADLALFRAKREGGRCYRLFDTGMARELSENRAIKIAIGRAGANREWSLLYQPQISLHDGRLIGAEALLRWQHPDRGLLLPAAFMPLLETHAAAFEVGCWVIDTACRQLVTWRRQGLTIERIAVNLFAAQVRAGNLAAIVCNALDAHGLRPSDLELEITESIALRQDDGLDQLHALHDAGVAIAFDDFGTGFASLTTLKRFPLSRLKIDRSFVADLCSDSHSAAITGGVITIGHRLGLCVIAEGIEHIEQERALAALGCDEGQGYLYGRPMSGDALRERFLQGQLFPV